MLFVTKVRQDNDVTECIGTNYVEIDIELSWPIWSSTICDKTIWDNDMTNCKDVVYAINDTKLLRPIELGTICDKNQLR